MSTYLHSQFAPDPLQRLHVYDGLMMNARRWRLTDDYHRKRQNLQYQALNQPGIVCGLGVRLIDAPEETEARFRDRRWLEIQPGFAIDAVGNPIIVDPITPRTFRIYPTPRSGESLIVYVVVSYSEPTEPAVPNVELLREWFRFDQITHPPDGRQIELCRIHLKGTVELAPPANLFFPQVNQLDLRYRQQAKARPHTIVRVAQLKPIGFDESSDLSLYDFYQRSLENLSALVAAIASLHPAWEGDLAVPQLPTTDPTIAHYDLLYLADASALLQVSSAELVALKRYLQTGGLLLLERRFETDRSVAEILAHCEQILPDTKNFAETQTTTNRPEFATWDDLPRQHPLSRSPFLFGLLPTIGNQSLQLYTCGGIVLLDGSLSAAWGLAENPFLDRAEIRTAQEFGLNLLHYALSRRQMTQALHWERES